MKKKKKIVTFSFYNCYNCGCFTYDGGTVPICMNEDRTTKAFPSNRKLKCHDEYEGEKE